MNIINIPTTEARVDVEAGQEAWSGHAERIAGLEKDFYVVDRYRGITGERGLPQTESNEVLRLVGRDLQLAAIDAARTIAVDPDLDPLTRAFFLIHRRDNYSPNTYTNAVNSSHASLHTITNDMLQPSEPVLITPRTVEPFWARTFYAGRAQDSFLTVKFPEPGDDPDVYSYSIGVRIPGTVRADSGRAKPIDVINKDVDEVLMDFKGNYLEEVAGSNDWFVAGIAAIEERVRVMSGLSKLTALTAIGAAGLDMPEWSKVRHDYHDDEARHQVEESLIRAVLQMAAEDQQDPSEEIPSPLGLKSIARVLGINSGMLRENVLCIETNKRQEAGLDKVDKALDRIFSS